MNKEEFLVRLRKKLSGLPQDDIEGRLTFYSEMIDDRMEEGLSENEAVSAVGDIDVIVEQTIADISLAKLARERIRPKRHLKVWEIVLLALGSPIWLSLTIAAAAVILSVYIVLWAVIVSLWSVFAAFIGCGVGSLLGSIVFGYKLNVLSGIAMLAAGFVSTGLSVFMFYGCKAATKGILLLTKKIAMLIKNCFIEKEEA